MKIHEYQAKQLLKSAGAAVPHGIVAGDHHEVQRAFHALGQAKAVIKTQIHAGGRGKGRFKGSGSEVGGVKVVGHADEAKQLAEIMFKYPLVTKQTGEQGQRVSKVLVEEPSSIAREIYLGLVIDRGVGLPVLMASKEGGMDIEEVAARNPQAILKTPIDPDRGLLPYQARRLAFDLDLKDDQIPQLEKLMTALVRVFLDYDCSLAEINPLVVTTDGKVIALDAKMTFDDNALFRHPDIELLARDLAEENPAELRASKAGLSYVSLHGNIGCLVNGAGLAMSTMDIIKLHGGEPANFLDVGGANKDQVTEAFRILLSDDRVKAVLVNIFGGIMKCDIIAAAILAAFQEVKPKVPFVVRLEGTNVELGRKLLAESGLKITTATDLTDAAKKVVGAVRG